MHLGTISHLLKLLVFIYLHILAASLLYVLKHILAQSSLTYLSLPLYEEPQNINS